MSSRCEAVRRRPELARRIQYVQSAKAERKVSATPPVAYPVFVTSAMLLAIFFAVSFVIALTSEYFLDWASALVGLLGTAGLALVGWFSRLQTRS